MTTSSFESVLLPDNPFFPSTQQGPLLEYLGRTLSGILSEQAVQRWQTADEVPAAMADNAIHILAFVRWSARAEEASQVAETLLD